MAFSVETLAIGDELLTGRIADTNSAFVAGTLFREGLRLDRTTVVADEAGVIQSSLRECAQRSQIVLCFGGLGPTSDDKTAATVAELLGCPLIPHAASEAKLRTWLRDRGRPITPQVLKQIVYPEKAEPILNTTGLATGFRCLLFGRDCYFMPGVPREMKTMFTDSILPKLLAAAGRERTLTHTWRCLDLPESELQRVMDPIEAALPKEAWLGYRTRFPENHLTLYFRHPDSSPSAPFKDFIQRIGSILQDWSYTEQDKELEQIVLEQLARRGQTLALAESCTGGLVAQRLTRIAGASKYFWGGYTTYQVGAKSKMLGVDVASAEAAVSASCTRSLAEAVQRKSGCAVAAAITGYLGPTGGTVADPIGTLYLCVSGIDCLEKRVVQIPRERTEAQWGASTHLLNLLRVYLEGA